MPLVASSNDPSFGPSLSHASVTGAGRSAKDTKALRAGQGGGVFCQFAISDTFMPVSFNSL